MNPFPLVELALIIAVLAAMIGVFVVGCHFTVRLSRFWPLGLAYVVAFACLVLLTILQTGCESVHQSRPVKGGAIQIMADGSVIVTSPDNAKTPTPVSITRADGTQVSAELGTSSEPIITLKPGPKWSEWMVTAAGILCLIGGVVLAVKAWPRIGAALALCGLLLIGIGIMAGTHAWVIALGTAFIFLLVIGGLYYGYRTGTTQPAPAPAAA